MFISTSACKLELTSFILPKHQIPREKVEIELSKNLPTRSNSKLSYYSIAFVVVRKIQAQREIQALVAQVPRGVNVE